MNGNHGLTRELARFAIREHDAIPEPAFRMGKQMLLNAIGLALGSAHEPAIEIEYAMVQAMRTPPEATVIGRGTRVSATWAAFLNGTGIHLEDFDDSHYKSKMKPSGPIPAAALAMGEYLGSSGRELIEAVVIGSEVAIRVLLGYGERTFNFGWHPTGSLGPVGGAVAAGRLAGLDEERMLDAIGIAATEAAGLLMSATRMSKPLQVGKAAMQGIEAVQLAQLGLRGSPTSIEGRRGLGNLMSGGFDESLSLDGLGKRWEMAEDALKPYACGVVVHPLIDATLELREHFSSPDELERIEISTHPFVLKALGNQNPKDGLESKFSGYHGAAVGFLDGAAGPRQFTDEHAVDATVAAFRRKITILSSDKMSFGAAIVTAYAKDGRKVSFEKNADRVMTQDELERKVRLLGGDRVEPIFAAMERLEALDTMETLIASIPSGPSVH